MNCHICNATIYPPESRLTATVFHFWSRCCPACREKYGERDADGKIITREEKH